MIVSDIVVIGAGPAGLFSVFQAGMLNMKCVIFDSLQEVGGQCNALYPKKPIFDIPAFKEIEASTLINNLYEQSIPFKPTFFLSESVIKIQKKDDGYYYVSSNRNNVVKCLFIIIATGSGNIQPRKIPLKKAAEIENISIFYSIKNVDMFKNKNVLIAGGGDSAADWAFEVGKIAKKTFLVHRRSVFKCCPHTLQKLSNLSDLNKLQFLSPYNIKDLIIENGKLSKIQISSIENKEIVEIEADYLLAFFGLETNNNISKLCEVDCDKTGILVNKENMKTSQDNIYAVGDASSYQNRLHLILNGFTEAAIACREIYKLKNSTTSDNIPYSTTKKFPA